MAASFQMRSLILPVLFLLLTLCFAGCIESEEEDVIQVTDMVGRTVKVPKDVTRVVGLGVGALRFITYLDGADMVVGIEKSTKNTTNVQAMTYLLAHPEYEDLPSIGPLHGGEATMIKAVSPDVIFKTTYAEGDCQELQKKIGIPVVGLLGYCGWERSPNLEENIDELYSQLRLVGEVLGNEQRAEDLAGNVEGIINDLGNRTRDIPDIDRPGIYVGGIPTLDEEGTIKTYSSHAMLDMINARNIITSEMLDGEKEGELPKAMIPDLDPEIMFLYLAGSGSCTLDLTDAFELDNVSWNQVDAIVNNQVYSMIGHYKYGYNFDTMLANCYWAGKNIYPEAFTDIDPAMKADEIFTLWIGTPVYDQLKGSTGEEIFTRIELL